MIKVLMVCSGGMSSAIVVKAVEKEAEKKGLPIQLTAVGTGEFERILRGGDYQVVLVAPQIRHRYQGFEEVAKELNVPIGLISPQGYTPLGGSKVIQMILEMNQS